MLYYGDKENEGMNGPDSSDSENEDGMHSQIARPVSSIQSAKIDNKGTLDGLPKSVNDFFQSMNMDCFPEAKGMEAKAQPWRHIWTGPRPPSEDGKLLVACPKHCQYATPYPPPSPAAHHIDKTPTRQTLGARPGRAAPACGGVLTRNEQAKWDGWQSVASHRTQVLSNKYGDSLKSKSFHMSDETGVSSLVLNTPNGRHEESKAERHSCSCYDVALISYFIIGKAEVTGATAPIAGSIANMGPGDEEHQPFGPPSRKFSFRLPRRFTAKSSKSGEFELETAGGQILHPTEEIKIFDNLITLLVNRRPLPSSLDAPCQWYRKYLKNNIIDFWPLIRSALNHINIYSPRPNRDELETVVKFVIEIARLLITEKDLALAEIVDPLVNDKHFKSELMDSDEYRIIPYQLVFAVIGWLLLLFEVPLVQRPHRLQIKDTLSTSSSASGYLNSRNFRERSQGFGFNDRPIHMLLKQFGDIIPEVKPIVARRDCAIPISETITVQLVCYATAFKITELEIEWVDSLGLHLELDASRKTLKLFRFPSYCRMMYHPQNIHLKLLTAHAMSQSESRKELVIPADEFFREVLLTYRVLFGQDEGSNRAFQRLLPIYDRNWDCSAKDPDQVSDPLLPILCGKSWTDPEARDLYDDVNAGAVREFYDANVDFPIMGQKLMELQQFVANFNPTTLKALINDRRNPMAWLNFWTNQTLLLFACLAILINALQLVFQIWQVILARQQSAQPGPATGM